MLFVYLPEYVQTSKMVIRRTQERVPLYRSTSANFGKAIKRNEIVIVQNDWPRKLTVRIKLDDWYLIAILKNRLENGRFRKAFERHERRIVQNVNKMDEGSLTKFLELFTLVPCSPKDSKH